MKNVTILVDNVVVLMKINVQPVPMDLIDLFKVDTVYVLTDIGKILMETVYYVDMSVVIVVMLLHVIHAPVQFI